MPLFNSSRIMESTSVVQQPNDEHASALVEVVLVESNLMYQLAYAF